MAKISIPRKFIDTKWFFRLYPYDPDLNSLPQEVTKLTAKVDASIELASQRVNTISGGTINNLLRQGSLMLTDDHDDNEQTYAVKLSTALYVEFIQANGYDFFLGSTSSSLGGVSASVSPNFQDAVALLDQKVAELLENAGIITITTHGRVSLTLTDTTTPVPPPPPAGNWDAQKQFETCENQFFSSNTISVQFNPENKQVEWNFIGTIPGEWNATKQYEALKNQLVAGANTTITPNDTNHTFTFASTGGGGSDAFATGQRVPEVRIDDTTPSSLQTKAVVEGKVAVKLDTSTFNQHVQTQYTPLKNLVDNHTADITNLTTDKLDKNFANALLPSAFNNKGLKWTGTTFEPQAFGETPTRDNTWEIFKEVFKPDISQAAGCVTVDEAKKTLSYRPCINQLETQIQEIQNGLQGVSFTPPTGKKYLAVGVGNLLTYETAIKAITPTNTYPIIKEIVQAGTNLTFRWQDDIHALTINADDQRFADNSVVSDYAPIGDGTQLVAMNQFDQTATGKFLKKIDQG